MIDAGRLSNKQIETSAYMSSTAGKFATTDTWK